jgi:transposase
MSNQEIVRRKQYCQIIKEITGSDQYLVIGIDVGKDKHHAFLGSATGKSLFRKLIFENNLDGFSRLLQIADEIKSQNGLTKIVYGVEPTGNYHKPLARHLIRCACNVVLVSGVALKRNRELLNGRWDKNDTKDAANIADLVSRGRCLYYDCPSPGIIEIRALLSLRRRLKREEHGIRMRIRNNLLAQYFPELDRFYSACESESLSIVRWFLNPDTIAAMEFGEFFHLVIKTHRGTAQKLRLRKIHRLAIDSVGCPVGAAAEYEADLLVEKLEQVRGQIQKTNDLIEDICLQFPEYSYLLTIPGFGPYISAKVLSSISDPFRFENRKQLIKMSGYDLCAQRSGKTSDKAVPSISKKGNAELRHALYQAAHVASTRVDLFKIYFNNLLRGRERERGIITKMRVKLAAKMLIIAWTLMKKREPFDPAHLSIE